MRYALQRKRPNRVVLLQQTCVSGDIFKHNSPFAHVHTAASAMPLLEHNITANGTLFSHPSVRPRALVLDWDDDLPDDITGVEDGFDAILCAPRILTRDMFFIVYF